MNSLALNIAMAKPTVSKSATAGGSLADATYYYVVSAIMAVGPGGPVPGTSGSTGVQETVNSTEVSQATSTTNNSVTLTWPAIPGATGYRIYGRATGAETLMKTIAPVNGNTGTQTFIDNGSITPGTTAYLTTATAKSGNCFLPGGNVGVLNAASAALTAQGLTAAPVKTPFIAGRNVTLINMTSGTITLHKSPDGVTFDGTGYASVAVATLSCVDTTLPEFAYASAAGLYALGGP